MNDTVKIYCKKLQPRFGYICDIISQCACKSIFKASLVSDGGAMCIDFFTNGYIPLQSASHLSIDGMLQFFLAYIDAAEGSLNSLITPDDMVLNGETVYVSGCCSGVRFVYKPAKALCEGGCLQEDDDALSPTDNSDGEREFACLNVPENGALENESAAPRVKPWLTNELCECIAGKLTEAGKEYLTHVKGFFDAEGMSVIKKKGLLEELRQEAIMSGANRLP